VSSRTADRCAFRGTLAIGYGAIGVRLPPAVRAASKSSIRVAAPIGYIPHQAVCKRHPEPSEIMDVRSYETEVRALMLAGLDGDARAHCSLLKGLSSHLRAYFKGRLARIGRSAADAEDLVQETLIAIHTRRHTYDPTQRLTPWVYAIARYRLVDFFRRTKASIKDVPIDEDVQLFAEDDAGAVESELDLERLLSQLSPKARHAIQLVKLEGLSASEAAARSSSSPSAVKVSVHRGLRALSLLVKQRNSR
jgi:RNA polymerase sigma-70 factor, ECF subfamily